MHLYNMIYVCIWYRDIYIKYDVCTCIHTHIYVGTYMDNMSVCENRIFALGPFSGIIKSPIYLNIAPSKTHLSPVPNNSRLWRWLRILQKKLNCIEFTWYKNTEIYYFETNTMRKTLLLWGILLFESHTCKRAHPPLPITNRSGITVSANQKMLHEGLSMWVWVCVYGCRNGQVWEYVLFQWI